jgi:MFS family permease
MRYLIAQIVFNVSNMASGFLIVYVSKTWALSDSQASGYVIAMQVGQSLANLFFGFLADRKGHKLVLELSALIGAISFAVSFFAPSAIWFFPIFFLRGASLAAGMISGTSIVIEFTRPEDRPTYIGLANSIPGFAGSIAPLIGGWLAGASGYPLTFVLSAVAGLASFVVLHWMVREPRHTGPGAIFSEAPTP